MFYICRNNNTKRKKIMKRLDIMKRIKEIETKKGVVSNEEIKELVKLRAELSFIDNWNF